VIKRILLAVFEFAVYLLLLGIGGYWDVARLLIGGYAPRLGGLLNLLPLLKYPIGSHILIADGIVFAGVFCLILLLLEAVRKAARSTMATTVILYMLAVALSLAFKVGLPPAS
jgi:hypothetical protein